MTSLTPSLARALQGTPHRSVETLLFALALGFFYLGCFVLAHALAPDALGMAGVWTANAVLTGVLLASPPDRRPGYLAAGFLAALLGGWRLLPAGFEAAAVLAVIAGAESAAIAALARRWCRSALIFDSATDIARFAAIVLAVALVAASLGALVPALAMGAWWPSQVVNWLLCHLLVMLVASPIIIIVMQATSGRSAPPARLPRAAVLLLYGAVGLAAGLAFFQSAVPLLFLPVPLLFLMAYLRGPLGVASGTLLVIIVGVAATLAGAGPVSAIEASATFRLVFLQAYVSFGFLTALPLAAMHDQRRRLLEQVSSTAQRLARVIDRSREVIYETDAWGGWTFLSPSVMQLTGHRAEDRLGGNWLEMVHPDDRQQALADFAPMLAGHEEHTAHEVRIVHSDGSLRWVKSRASALRDARGAYAGVFGTMYDATAEVAALQQLAESEARYRVLAENAHDVVFRATAELTCTYVSPAVDAMFGREPSWLEGRSIHGAIHPDDQERARDAYRSLVEGRAERMMVEYRARHADGRWLWIDVRAQRVAPEADGSVIVGSARDITERRHAEQRLATSEQRYRDLADHSTDTIYRADPTWRCLYVSPAVERLAGVSPDALTGQDLLLGVHPDDRAIIETARDRMAAGEDAPQVFQYRILHASRQEYFWVEAHSRPVRDHEGRLVSVLGTVRDIEERKQLEVELTSARDEARALADRLFELATTDALTGLANRRHFLGQLDDELRRAARSGAPLSLAILDVDHFKQVNDSLGHAAGDEVLKGMADTMRHAMRQTDVLGRIGGEEFAILMPDTSGDAAITACERLRAAIAATPIVLTRGPAAIITASIGVSALKASEGAGELLRRADEALYTAKRAGRNRLRPAA